MLQNYSQIILVIYVTRLVLLSFCGKTGKLQYVLQHILHNTHAYFMVRYMSLVQRQSPEQIESHTRQNFRRAVIGIAACIGSLLGISAAATSVAALKVDQGHEALKDYLIPDERGNKNAAYRHVSKQQPDTDHWPPVSFRMSGDDMPAPAPERDHDVAWTAGLVGGAGAVSFGALMLLGSAKRRREGPAAPDEIDYETTEEYGFYDFELRQMIGEQRMRDGLDQLETGSDSLETRLEAAEQKATASLIAARLGLGAHNQHEPINLAHLRVLGDMGKNPLGALNYSCPETFYEFIERGESVATACQPVWPELQQINSDQYYKNFPNV